MAMPKCFWFFFWFCMIVAMLQQPRELEARPLTLQKGRLNNFVATLGIECKCCDGIKENIWSLLYALSINSIQTLVDTTFTAANTIVVALTTVTSVIIVPI
ncbi:hypothetical protein SO802_017005 [Lithocarpus litseifolius]|uniref:Uncharacterized protein n=1 Tax=Lithocarpus litseifolius TaxID=425828 RepID=A0AAW2CYS7_9ROSI